MDKVFLEANIEKTLLDVETMGENGNLDDLKDFEDFIGGTQEVTSDTRFLLAEEVEI